MRVSDVMTRQVVTISPASTLQAAAAEMRATGVGILPVRGPDRLEGVLTDRDIVVRAVAQGADVRTATVREAMTHQLFSCYEDEPLGAAAQVMEERAVRRLVVLDRFGQPVGMLSLDDLSLVEAGHAREVLGRVASPPRPNGLSG